MKILLFFLLSLNIVLANEGNEDSNIVKTSELELFLFKIGFQSLLKDVDITKNKVSLNEEELKKLNSKIEIIMDELYKSKRVLKTDTSSVIVHENSNIEEINKLKEEISLLKLQMEELKLKKDFEVKSQIISKKNKSKSIIAKVIRENISVRNIPHSSGKIVGTYTLNDEVKIDYCNKFDWCKIKGEKKYIAKFLLSL